MTSFTFTAEQLRAAPPEVRHWVENEVATALAALDVAARDPSQVQAARLAACTPEEAMQVFELLGGNHLLVQVLMELGRDAPNRGAAPPLHALDVRDLLRHTRLADGDRLAGCLSAINQAFQRVRNDPEASLFGFDPYGHVYIHETTHASVRQLWEQLIAAQAPRREAAAAAPEGFSLPHLGPSEAVAGHAPAAGNFNF